jgi:hypothetical protein
MVKEDLGEDLCLYCPLDKNMRGIYSSPGGMVAGCEGYHCDEAYDSYLESLVNPPCGLSDTVLDFKDDNDLRFCWPEAMNYYRSDI